MKARILAAAEPVPGTPIRCEADAAIALWMKDAAPSTELRRWFGHDPARWPDFRRRYEAHNDAVALRELLLRKPHR